MAKFYPYLLLVFIWIAGINISKSQNTVVTPAPSQTVCVGSGYITLAPIYIAETNVANFDAGAGQTYIISVPANFEFNTSVTPSVSKRGNGISNIVVSAPTSTTLTFTYDVSGPSTGVGPLDSLIITGIQVRATAGGTTGSLARSGGTAIQTGNAIGAQVHCLLTSGSPLAITGQPSDVNACLNTNPSFNVVATGGIGTITYAWERDNGSGFSPAPSAYYDGENTATITINPGANSGQNGFKFRCVVSAAACGSPITSSEAILYVNEATTITSNPSNKSICGGNVTFTVGASTPSSGTNIFQWQESTGGPYSNISNGGVYSGTNTSTLTLINPASSMSGRSYRCVVNNSICSTTATSSAASLTVTTPVTITSNPSDKIGCVNDDPTFSVTASGGGTLTYQWQRDKNDGNGFADAPSAYSNTTTSTMRADNVNTSQNGYLFRCIVSNSCSSDTSEAAVLTVYNTSNVNYFGLSSSYCRNSLKDTLEGYPSTGVFSGSGITNLGNGKAVFNPLTAGTQGSKTITYTLGCVINKTYTLNDTTNIAYTSPANASPTYTTTDLPVDLVVETIPPSGALSGVFSGTGVSVNKFYPNIAGEGGPYKVTFTFNNPSGCTSKVATNISVTSPGLGIPQLRERLPFCQGGSYVLLSDTTVDGPTPLWGSGRQFAGYTGKGITHVAGNEYKFAPDSAGSYTIYYNVLYDYGTFQFVLPYASQNVIVNAQTPVDFNLPTDVCRTSDPINLNPYPGVLAGATGTSISVITPASPPGGLLSGTNNTIFNPSASGSTAVTYTVRYTFVNGLGCPTNLEKKINVFPKPPVPAIFTLNTNWGSQNEEFCYGTPRKPLWATPVPANLNSTFTWYNNAGLVGTPISNSYLLYPQPGDNEPDTYHYYVTQTAFGCTSDPLEVTVKINDAAKVSAGNPQTICEGNTVTLNGSSTRLIANTSLVATWSSATATSSAFSPNANALGAIYTPTAEDIKNQYADLILTTDDPDGSGPCPAGKEVVRININKAASVYAGEDKTYCSNSPIVLSGSYSGSASATTWSGGGNPLGITIPGALNTNYTPTGIEKTGGTITFTLTSNDPDGVGPCAAATDNVVVTINPQPIVDAGPDQSVCRTENTIVSLSGASRSGGSNYAVWSGGSMNFGTYNSTDNDLSTTYTPTVSELPVNGKLSSTIKLYLTSDDPDGSGPTGPCLASKDSMLVIINPLPRIDSVIVPKITFCKSDPFFQIKTVSKTSYGISSEKYLDFCTGAQGVSGTNFFPSIADPGTHTLRYEMTDNNNCKNYRDTVIDVYAVPVVYFSIDKFCATSPTFFDGAKSLLINDPASTINYYKWTFGDNSTESDTSLNVKDSYIYPATLNPSAKQEIRVSLKVGTDKQCFNSNDTTIVVGNIPATDFSWSGICPSDSTKFVDLSNFPITEVADYTWKFGTEYTASGATSAFKNRKYRFNGGRGVYDVKFKITSKIGCVDSMTHKVNILDYFKPTALEPYTKNFVTTDAYWAVDGQNPSWQWGAANKASINTGTRNTWVTNTTGTYNVNEKSYLNGPCFNFEDLKRPMISLKIWSATQMQIAGAILQYSTDGGMNWKEVGNFGSGINWYDALGVLGNPGNQLINQFGWTGQYGDWKTAKINLNNLADSSNVRLRLAFGSGPLTLNLQDGFAFDSIWVGERDKLLLVENFTNSSSSAAIAADNTLNTLVNSRANDVVAIHYHTGFPGTDPMNLRNQADPSSRVLHYGVTQVPYKVFEGNYDFGTALDDGDVDRKSLELARFKIKLGTSITNDRVNVKARIIAADSISRNFVVHVAVIERNVIGVANGNWEWVATNMLPDAGGTYFTRDFLKNDSADVDVSWDYFPTEVYDPSQLGVVAFIQDVVTKEIYQTAYELGTGGIITNFKNQLLEGKELFVYPNPSNHTTKIIFEEGVYEDLEYSLQNELGQIVDNDVILKGASEFLINTSLLTSGIYVIKIGNDKNGVAYKKIIVAH